MLNLPNLTLWLHITRTASQAPPYEHVLAKELPGGRASIATALQQIFFAAHQDARDYLRRIASPTLDPLQDGNPALDPAAGYPQILYLSDLQGYTGEILAGVFAENLSPWEQGGWKVPAFLFRTHLDAFRRLPYFTGVDDAPAQVPGRTGDDCLAFKRNDQGVIIGMLVCEAKCTLDHSAQLLNDAHSKAAQTRARSFDILQLIEVLNDQGDADSLAWCESLRILSRERREEAIRSDQITYVCGRSPVHTRQRVSWADQHTPSAHYTGNRPLQCIELHLNDVRTFILSNYSDPAGQNGTAP